MERMRFEEPRFRYEPMLEHRQNLEVARIKAVIARIIATPVGDPGLPPITADRFRQLEMILEAVPQRGRNGVLRYLVTSGLAVEMVTGFSRDHHDIDLVVFDPTGSRRWDILGTDNVTPGEYWADMYLDAEFLEVTARRVRTRQNGRAKAVEVVHPGVIMVQKASDAFGRPPRPKDIADVEAIIRYWKEREGYTREWNPIVRESIDALPDDQVDKTVARLRQRLG